MTDNEIKKAFMICNNLEDGYCSDCPFENCDRCIRQVAINTLDLINRQDEKINRLQAENERLTHITRNLIGEIKAEAYTEFAEKSEIELYVKRNERQKHWEEYLKQHNTTKDYQVHEWSVDNWLRGYGEAVQDIVSINDNLLKEMVGEDNA